MFININTDIQQFLQFIDKYLLYSEGSDRDGADYTFVEVTDNWGTGYRIDSI